MTALAVSCHCPGCPASLLYLCPSLLFTCPCLLGSVSAAGAHTSGQTERRRPGTVQSLLCHAPGGAQIETQPRAQWLSPAVWSHLTACHSQSGLWAAIAGCQQVEKNSWTRLQHHLFGSGSCPDCGMLSK